MGADGGTKLGFGLIFLGWSTLLFLKAAPLGIIGCILMQKGLEKLSGYNKYFATAKTLCEGFLVYFVLFGVLWTLDFTGIYPFNDITNYTDDVIYRCVLVTFSFYLYKALGDISKQVGFDKGIRREKTAVSIMIVYVAFTVIKYILIPFGYAGYLQLPLVVFELLWLLYSGMYIYSCYMMIATQEIIDEENKKMKEYDEKYSFRTPKAKKSKK